MVPGLAQCPYFKHNTVQKLDLPPSGGGGQSNRNCCSQLLAGLCQLPAATCIAKIRSCQCETTRTYAIKFAQTPTKTLNYD